MSGSTGSKDVLKEQAFIYNDSELGVAFRVYESVANDRRKADKNYSEMAFYIAPFFELLPQAIGAIGEQPRAFNRVEIGDEVSYTFAMECYNDRITDRARQKITEVFASTTNNFKFTDGQFSNMEHGAVLMEFGQFEDLPITIQSGLKKRYSIKTPISNGDKAQLNTPESFTVKVPKEIDNDFRTLLEAIPSPLTMNFTVFFNVMSLSKFELTLSFDDISETKQFKDLVSGGQNYVSAKQSQEIIKSAAQNKEVIIYTDPDIDAKLSLMATKIFEELMQKDHQMMLNARSQALSVDEALCAGTGLSPKEFLPITLSWDVHEVIKNETDHEKANGEVRKTFEDKKRDFESTLHLWGKAKSGGVTGVLGKASGGFDSNTSFEEYSAKVKSGIFQNSDELKEYQSQHTDQTGKKVFIVPRGLNVLETTHIRQHFNTTSRVLVVEPSKNDDSFMATLSPVSLFPRIRVAGGKTDPKNTNWQALTRDDGMNNIIFVDVDTSSGGFKKTPSYFASLHGGRYAVNAIGGDVIFRSEKDGIIPTPTGFRVLVRWGRDVPGPEGNPNSYLLTPEFARAREFHIHWYAYEQEEL